MFFLSFSEFFFIKIVKNDIFVYKSRIKQFKAVKVILIDRKKYRVYRLTQKNKTHVSTKNQQFFFLCYQKPFINHRTP